MIDKNGTITLENWQQGIGTSPYTGFADVRNCDIHSPDGVLKIALAPTKISSTTVTGLPTWMSADRANLVFYFGGYLDTNVYKISSGVVSVVGGSSIGVGTGGGAVYKNYLVVADIQSGSDYLDLYNIAAPAWSNNWFGLNSLVSGDVAPFYKHNNDTLYFGNGRYVGSLTDPTNVATANYNVLDLPTDYKIDSISGLSTNLMVGASKRPTGSVPQDSYEGAIFPWDTVSASFTLPIILDRGGVKQLISRNGNITFANGKKGDFLITNGSFTQPLPEVGLLKNNAPSSSFDFYPEAKAFVNGEYLFGVSSSSAASPAGIYGFKNGAWRFLENSTAATGGVTVANIGVIYPKDDTNFYVGWQDGNSTYGIDEFGSSNYYYTGYRARVDSPLYQVGTSLLKKQYTELSIYLGKPLTTGQGIKISYRTNLNDSFTVAGTYDFATYGGITTLSVPASIIATDQLQIRVELTTGASSTTTPELRKVVLN